MFFSFLQCWIWNIWYIGGWRSSAGIKSLLKLADVPTAVCERGACWRVGHCQGKVSLSARLENGNVGMLTICSCTFEWKRWGCPWLLSFRPHIQSPLDQCQRFRVPEVLRFSLFCCVALRLLPPPWTSHSLSHPWRDRPCEEGPLHVFLALPAHCQSRSMLTGIQRRLGCGQAVTVLLTLN